MKKYMVTYRSGYDRELYCATLTGTQLAHKYGFSNCSGDDVLYVYELMHYGKLIPCSIWPSMSEPLNVLYVHRAGNYEPDEYEWPEH